LSNVSKKINRIVNLKLKSMKKSHLLIPAALLLIAFVTTCLISGCKNDGKNESDDTTKSPLWTYDTGEDPYGSTPWIAGNNLVVCSRQDGKADLGTVHCISSATGAFIWKMTDSTVVCTNPVVYNNYVIYGGYNVHALNLSNGSHEWDYRDDLLKVVLFSSPLLDEGHVYFASYISMLNLDATNAGIAWENEEDSFINVGLPAPFMENGKVYYATTMGRVYQLDANTGTIDWFLEFESGLDNAPLVYLDRIFVGVHETDPAKNSLFCYFLDDHTLSWSKKIGQVLSNMNNDGDKLYVVGNQTLYCLSTSDGNEHWHYVMLAGSIAKPFVSGGKLYTGNGANLLCLDASTGALIWSYATADDNGFSSPVISGDKLYVSCGDGKIYCFAL
jgi:outer membrane protein assembly factor BamB